MAQARPTTPPSTLFKVGDRCRLKPGVTLQVSIIGRKQATYPNDKTNSSLKSMWLRGGAEVTVKEIGQPLVHTGTSQPLLNTDTAGYRITATLKVSLYKTVPNRSFDVASRAVIHTNLGDVKTLKISEYHYMAGTIVKVLETREYHNGKGKIYKGTILFLTSNHLTPKGVTATKLPLSQSFYDAEEVVWVTEDFEVGNVSNQLISHNSLERVP